MRKVRLQLDALQVETFATETPRTRRGTVAAHAATEWQTCGHSCDVYTCGIETCLGGQQTCWDSCDGVCNSYFCV